MDLAVITPFPPRLTGIGQYGMHLCQAMAQSGQFDRITVLTEDARGESGITRPGLEIQRIWRYGHPALGFQILWGLERIGSQKVWVNFGFSAFGPSPVALLSVLIGLTLAARRGFALLITLHETHVIRQAGIETVWGFALSPILYGLTRWLARLGAIAAPLQVDVEWLRSHLPEATIVHLPLGSFYPPQALPEPEIPHLLFFGSLAPYKGLTFLIEAFHQLHSDHPDLILEIAGAEHPRFPGYAQRLRAACASHPGIRWTGPVSEEDVEPLFARSLLVLLPYQQATGPSSVMYRAAAWGRPMVASDIPALRTTAAEAALIVNWAPPGDPVALAQAIKPLIRCPDLRKQQAQPNLQAIAACTMPHIADAYVRILKTLSAPSIPLASPLTMSASRLYH